MSEPRTAPPSPAHSSPSPRGSQLTTRALPQFSMRTLLIVVTIVAIACALLPYFGFLAIGAIAASLTLYIVPVALGAFALYCRGHRQTFFLGAFAGSFALFFFGGPLARDVAQFIALILVTATSAGTCGLVALSTRRFIERRGWHLPERNPGPRDPGQRP